MRVRAWVSVREREFMSECVWRGGGLECVSKYACEQVGVCEQVCMRALASVHACMSQCACVREQEISCHIYLENSE